MKKFILFVAVLCSSHTLLAQCSSANLIANANFNTPYQGSSGWGMDYLSSVGDCSNDLGDDVFGLVSGNGSWNSLSSPDNSNMWGFRDVDGDCGSGTGETLTFDFTIPSNASYDQVEICFDYKVIGFDDGDDIFTTIKVDGVIPCDELALYQVVDGSGNLNTFWTNHCFVVNVSPNSTIEFSILVVQNGSSDFGAIDNVCLKQISNAVTTCPPPLVCPKEGDLIITEIMYNPSGSQSSSEWFEVCNTSSGDIDMREMEIGDAGTTHMITNSLVVPAGGCVVFANGINSCGSSDYIYDGIDFNNTVDAVQIICKTNVIDMVIYGGTDFPSEMQGESIQFDADAPQNYMDNDDGTNWCVSTITCGPDTGTPGYENTHCNCRVVLGSPLFECITNTEDLNTDAVNILIPYSGTDLTIEGLSTSFIAVISGDNPATVNNGTIILTGLKEGDSWDLVLDGGVCDGDAMNGIIPSQYCDVPCMDPNIFGTATWNISMDLTTQLDAEAVADDWHNGIQCCPIGQGYQPVYGELQDDGDGNNSTGSIIGLTDCDGTPVSASYEVGQFDTNCVGLGLGSSLGNGTISTNGTFDANSPKPNLFNTHYSENLGEGLLNGLKINFATPVNDFGIFLGDWESSNHGKLGEIWLFDAGGNALAMNVLDPVSFGPINDESGCGEGQGDMNCGNGTTTWIGVTSATFPIACVVISLGDDDACFLVNDCDGKNEHLNFGGVTVGGVCSTVPVTLVDFTARQHGFTSVLEWSTASEINNEKFEIEWSQNGRDFVKVGEVKGNGTTTALKLYEFIHTYPRTGLNYYRLKQIDFDGTTEYSETKVVNYNYENVISFWPTVVKNLVHFELQIEGMAKVEMFSLDGRIVMEKEFVNQETYNIGHLSAGMYLLRMTFEERVVTKRIIKQ